MSDPNPSHVKRAPGATAAATARTPDRVLWILAGNLGIAALALAQTLHGAQRPPVVLALGLLALVLVALVAARASPGRRGPARSRGSPPAGSSRQRCSSSSRSAARRSAHAPCCSHRRVRRARARAALGRERDRGGDADDVPWQQLAAGAPPAPASRPVHAVGAALGGLLLAGAAVGAGLAAVDGRSGGQPAAGFLSAS